MSETLRKVIGLALIAVAFWMPDIGSLPLPIPTPFNPPPIPGEKLMVLLVEESEDRDDIGPAKTAALMSTEVRSYVKSKQGKFRLLDDDVPLDKEAEWVKAGMANERASVPWLVVSNGKSGASEPLPADEQALLARVKEFGGP